MLTPKRGPPRNHHNILPKKIKPYLTLSWLSITNSKESKPQVLPPVVLQPHPFSISSSTFRYQLCQYFCSYHSRPKRLSSGCSVPNRWPACFLLVILGSHSGVRPPGQDADMLPSPTLLQHSTHTSHWSVHLLTSTGGMQRWRPAHELILPMQYLARVAIRKYLLN